MSKVSSLHHLGDSFRGLLKFFQFLSTLFHLHLQLLVLLLDDGLSTRLWSCLVPIVNTLLLLMSDGLFLFEFVKICLMFRLIHHQGVMILE